MFSLLIASFTVFMNRCTVSKHKKPKLVRRDFIEQRRSFTVNQNYSRSSSMTRPVTGQHQKLWRPFCPGLKSFGKNKVILNWNRRSFKKKKKNTAFIFKHGSSCMMVWEKSGPKHPTVKDGTISSALLKQKFIKRASLHPLIKSGLLEI